MIMVCIMSLINWRGFISTMSKSQEKGKNHKMVGLKIMKFSEF